MLMNELNFKSESITEIEKVITIYFDLLYKGDKDLIETVFLPEANVSSLSNDKIVKIDMDGFRKRIAERQSPESIGEIRDDKIILIDISSPTTAMVKVKCNILHNNYIDYLSLLKVSGRWKIISKVFHMNPGI